MCTFVAPQFPLVRVEIEACVFCWVPCDLFDWAGLSWLYKGMLNGMYEFTRHAHYKMQQYGISEGRVKRIIRHPMRHEEGVLSGAVAVMQPASISRSPKGERVWKQEIWVMYVVAERGKGKKMIRVVTAWRYPGVSPKRDPIPSDVLREIASLL